MGRNRSVLIVIVLGVVAAGVGVWRFTQPPATVEPPAVPDTIPDAIVREALTEAREAVLKNPKSADAWGELGLVFRAHLVLPEAKACFIQAARLEPTTARWPYHLGVIAVLLPPDDPV